MNNGEKLLIMRNVRRLIRDKMKQPDNWELYSILFSAGFDVAVKRCIEMNIDPDETRIVEPL